MAGPAQKTLEATSQAKVEFTANLVMANPRSGVYIVNAGSGFLRITLPREKNDELLALRRANASSAQAWLDSMSAAILKQYEKAHSPNFTFTLTPIGGARAAKAPAETPARLPDKISKVPPAPAPKPEMAADTSAARKAAEERAREAKAETLRGRIPEFRAGAGETVPRAEFLGGSGEKNDRYVIQVNAGRAKSGMGGKEVSYPIILSSEAGDVYLTFELTLSQLRKSTIEGTASMIFDLAKRVSKALKGQNIAASIADFMPSFKERITSSVAKQAKTDPETYQPWADYINEAQPKQKPPGKK